MMKRLYYIPLIGLTCILVVLLTGCPSDFDSEYNVGYNIGYENGYDEGYDDGEADSWNSLSYEYNELVDRYLQLLGSMDRIYHASEEFGLGMLEEGAEQLWSITYGESDQYLSWEEYEHMPSTP